MNTKISFYISKRYQIPRSMFITHVYMTMCVFIHVRTRHVPNTHSYDNVCIHSRTNESSPAHIHITVCVSIHVWMSLQSELNMYRRHDIHTCKRQQIPQHRPYTRPLPKTKIFLFILVPKHTILNSCVHYSHTQRHLPLYCNIYHYIAKYCIFVLNHTNLISTYTFYSKTTSPIILALGTLVMNHRISTKRKVHTKLYWVNTISKLLKIIDFFCKRALVISCVHCSHTQSHLPLSTSHLPLSTSHSTIKLGMFVMENSVNRIPTICTVHR